MGGEGGGGGVHMLDIVNLCSERRSVRNVLSEEDEAQIHTRKNA